MKFSEVQERFEMEIIPQGISKTETSISTYIYVRVHDTIIRVRYRKDLDKISSASSIKQLDDGTEEDLLCGPTE